MEVSGQLHVPVALTREASHTHSIGSWVGPRADLDAVEKGKESFRNDKLIIWV